MTREDLITMGVTEEQASQIMKSLDGDFVTKSRFNEVNTELQKAKATIKERDKQLEDLKSVDADGLKQQIEELQTANANQKKAHETEIKQLRIDNAVDRALVGAKAKNTIATKALLTEFLKTAQLADDGTVKGLDNEIKRLTEDDSTAFLFDSNQKFTGAKPAEKGDLPPATMTLEKLRGLSPMDRYQFSVEHPDEYRALYQQGE